MALGIAMPNSRWWALLAIRLLRAVGREGAPRGVLPRVTTQVAAGSRQVAAGSRLMRSYLLH